MCHINKLALPNTLKPLQSRHAINYIGYTVTLKTPTSKLNLICLKSKIILTKNQLSRCPAQASIMVDHILASSGPRLSWLQCNNVA